MPRPSSTIRVRPLDLRDFTFVRELAARQANFTIPAPYVLWWLLKVKGSVCLIAEKPDERQLGYLLALPTHDPANGMFVWQLATSGKREDSPVIRDLLCALRDSLTSKDVDYISFTALDQSATFRAIRRDALSVFDAVPTLVSGLPELVAPGESEYRIVLHKRTEDQRFT